MVRIAVIDDEPKIRRGLTGMLEASFGKRASVRSFKSVSELIKSARKERIDILLTDICMPDMDGLELGNYLKMFYPKIRIIIISGYSNFEYAQAAITLQVCEYMLKPVDQEKLYSIVDRQVTALEREAALTGNFMTGSAGETLDKNTLISAMLYGNAQAVSSFAAFTDNRMPYYLVVTDGETDLCEAAAAFSGQCGWLSRHQRFYLITGIDNDAEADSVVRQLFEKALFKNGQPRIGISGQCYGGEMIHLAYMQAVSALKQEIYDESPGIWRFKGSGVWQFDGEKKALYLMNSVLSGDQYGEKLAAVKTEIRKAGPVYPMFEKNMKVMLETLIRLTEENRLSAKCGLMFKNIAGNIEAYRSLDAFFSDILSVFEEIADSANKLQRLRMERHIHKALEYIHENYCQDLTLEEVAAQADLNPAYFSSYFKKYTGSSFINYMTELRIKKAKSLLKEDNKKISEISELTGFNDMRYFAKIFKKYVGVTPSEYRSIAKTLYD